MEPTSVKRRSHAYEEAYVAHPREQYGPHAARARLEVHGLPKGRGARHADPVLLLIGVPVAYEGVAGEACALPPYEHEHEVAGGDDEHHAADEEGYEEEVPLDAPVTLHVVKAVDVYEEAQP